MSLGSETETPMDDTRFPPPVHIRLSDQFLCTPAVDWSVSLTDIGFHASHEPFGPQALRDLVLLAQRSGFADGMCAA